MLTGTNTTVFNSSKNKERVDIQQQIPMEHWLGVMEKNINKDGWDISTYKDDPYSGLHCNGILPGQLPSYHIGIH